MALTVKEKGGSGGYEPVEAGTYPARCVGVIDLGIQHNTFNNKDQEKVMLMFELPTERITVDGEDKPRWLSARYTASLNEKATLRKTLDAWRGKPFTQEELLGFYLGSMINAPCMLTVTNTEKNGNTYANISGVSKIMKGMEVPPLESEPINFDMDAENAEEVKAKLPNWVQKIIEESVSWKSRDPLPMSEMGDDSEEPPF